MSKRKLAATGWISFTGLRFTKKFATREEIVEAIRRFFEEKGIDHFGHLRVEFRMDGSPEFFGALGQPLGSYTIDLVQVFLPPQGNRACFFETLGHELDHHKWYLNGREWDFSRPYLERPHELSALQEGQEWHFRYN